MVTIDELDPVLRDAAEELGVDELVARLTEPPRQRQMDHVHDFVCPQCKAGVTQTRTYGEVGHQSDCWRREKYYDGSSRAQPEIVDRQSALMDYSVGKARADGGGQL